MDLLGKVLFEWSVRCEKGYPDFNNEQDLAIFESMFGFNLVQEAKKDFSHLSKDAQEVAASIGSQLGISKENIKAYNRNTIVIITDENRNSLFDQLEDLGFERDFNISGSSQGGVKNEDGIKVIIKPLSMQGARSAGKQNEASFFELINSHIEENEEPITVILKSSKKSLKYENVARCTDASATDATKFFKADAQFVDPSNKVLANISLKKRNAVRWESSKRRPIAGINVFSRFIEKALQGEFKNVVLKELPQKNKYKLFNPLTDKVLSKVILENTPDEVIEDVVFGSDDPKTVVVKETFEGGFKKYSFNNGILTINCHIIYTDVDDIDGTDDEPIFAFSNHIGQAYGIEFRSFSKGLLYKGNELRGSAISIDFNELNK